jgi:hypothetical protein
MVFGTYKNDDELNRKGYRNATNTDIDDYNCGGYALGTFSWYCPYHDIKWAHIWERGGRSLRGHKKEFMRQAIETMLEDFPNLRRIHFPIEATPNERVIALRLADHDFHFMYRGLNKVWYQKMGGTELQRVPKAQVTARAWNNYFGEPTYKGKIVYFAMKVRNDIV